MGAALASLSPSKLARQGRLSLPAPSSAHDDKASEDEHGGDGGCEAHGQTARPLFTR